jgi:GTP-binding protein YchF
MLSVGIVGLPNVGKSTVFNALSSAGAKVSDYAFCTIEPNHAVVPVPDPRVERVAEIFGQGRAVTTTIEFVDIAGLVRGASRGEGLGNQFLAAIREVDAILHVVRCFADARVAPTESDLDPVREVGVVETELGLADLQSVERRREKIRSAAKGRDKNALREEAALEKLAGHLDSGEPARTAAARDEVAEAVQVFLLTDKPVVYLANTGEEAGTAEPAAAELSAHVAGPVVTLRGKLEADLGELDQQERAAFMAELGIAASGLERVVQACYEALGLVTFYTGIGAEARAWTVARGASAAAAAGCIHSDMERGFVRAEVIGFDALAEVGSWEAAKRAGQVQTEGRDYCVQDGDVLLVRFSP